MKLIECYIENFGNLSDFKYTFSDGINVIKRDNGFGKTTLSVFIKAMFFGLDESKKVKIEENDRKRYLPWNDSRCAGSLVFEIDKKRYRIERSFAKKAADDTFKLYDEKSGKESNIFSKSIGEELFGIDEDGFERTVFLSEANLSGMTENKKIASKLSDLVGCEGDLDVMDEAIKLLEKQRKTYHRRGGAGEIGSISEKLTDIELKINDLTRMKKALADEEEKLRQVSAELNSCREKRNRLLAKARLVDIARTKRTYEKQYLEMKKTLDEDMLIYDRLKSFFKDTPPSPAELEKARELYSEYKRIKASISESEETYAKLPYINVSKEEYENARLICDSLKEKERERYLLSERLKTQTSDDKSSANLSITEEYIERLSSKNNSKKANKSLYIALFSGIFLMLIGAFSAALIHAAASAVSVIGAAILIFSIIKLTDGKSNSNLKEITAEAIEFAKEYRPYSQLDESNILNALYELRGEAYARSQSEKDAEEIREKICTLSEKISESERVACEFLAHFPTTDAPNICSALEEVLQKRAIATALSDAARKNEEKRNENVMLASKYFETVSEFLSRFGITSDRPFDEISSKLIEYNTLKRTIIKTKNTIEAFISEHSIDPKNISGDNNIEVFENPDDPTFLAKIKELEKEKTLIERQCRMYSDEIERIDELRSEHELYSEKLTRYKRILDINQKTQQLLTEAKDSLTAKYLSKTKSAFDKYISEIAKENAEDFKMDTSFAIMKNERGSLKSAIAYSKGTRDIYFLATRFALIDSLYEKESPFIILDDPFAYFDDTRLTRALKAIQRLAKEKQIVYFTCQDARKP